MKTYALCVILTAAICTQSFGGDAGEVGQAARDKGLETYLTEMQVDFKYNSNGIYLISYPLNEGRSQLVAVDSQPTELGPLKMRRVWSISNSSTDLPQEEVLKFLLDQNSRMALGKWEIAQTVKGYWVSFSMAIPFESELPNLRVAIDYVARVSDEVEEILTHKNVN